MRNVVIVQVNKYNFRQAQPFVILLNTTCFDQKSIVFRCFNTQIFKNKVKKFDENLQMM